MDESNLGASSSVTVGREVNNTDSSNDVIDGRQANDKQFIITKCRRDSIEDDHNDSNNQETSEDSDVEEKVLVVYWRAGKLGAAYYCIQTSELFILDEIVDRPPDHEMVGNLYRQVEPKYLVTDGKVKGHFIKHIKAMVFDKGATRPGSDHCKLTLVSSKEYNYEACKRRIHTLSLPYEPEHCTDEERLVFLRTIVDFGQTQTVHALGTLLRYLDSNWSNINTDLQNKPGYICLKRISLADIVTIDDDTYKGLQIFRSVSHPSDFKKGVRGSGKEGLSLYSMFNKCCSKAGQRRLRVLLQHPTRDMTTLTRRQDVVAFFMSSQNDSIMKNICSSLRFIKNVNGLLTKIKSLSAKSYQWKSLYNTLYNVVLICEMCENVHDSELLQQVGSCDNNKLYEMALYMNRIIDFDLSRTEGKFTVKPGVDPELDKKKQTMASLQGLMSETAKLELKKLPLFISECIMMYIPHLGYLLGVKASSNTEQKHLPDMKFMFQNNDYIHYKSKGCEELDAIIGDTYPEIVAHETRIMMRLTTVILDNLHTLADLIDKCAELDCLIAISRVCKEHGFVRPALTHDKVIDIRRGRHPLYALYADNFVANDTLSSESGGYAKVLTGPNASGKSVYLKQVGLIVYLAHVGSFVPAESARVGLLGRIHSRIQSTECVAAHMSAFLVDLRQMALALGQSDGHALVLVDEFGKGTARTDGPALLAACLNTLLYRGHRCPHLLLSTHYLNIRDYIIETPLLKFQHLEHMLQDGEVVFLYRLSEGCGQTGLAHLVARAAGIQGTLVDRARTLLNSITKNILPPADERILSELRERTRGVKRDLLAE